MALFSPSETDQYSFANFERIKKLLDEGLSLATAKGISEDDLEAVYSLSYNYYQQRKFKEAEQIFKFLCLYSHMDSRFWIGLGACREALGKYRRAVEAYSHSALLEHDNPIPPLQAAKCYLAINEFEQAESGLNAAIHWSKGKQNYRSVLATAQSLLDKLHLKSNEATI